MTTEDREHIGCIGCIQNLTREAAYHACRLEATGVYDEAYSRAMDLYDRACTLLMLLSPDTAQQFIRDTYTPQGFVPYVARRRPRDRFC